MQKKKKLVFTILIISFLFAVKMYLNSFLLAENGDTYDFFKIAYSFQHFDFLYDSKRMPFLPLLLTVFPSEWFVWIGRFWVNLFYILCIVVFYKIIKKLHIKSINPIVPFAATAVFATNILVFENSFYILADTPFLFFTLLFMYFITEKNLNLNILGLTAALAFYTRPEGILLIPLTIMVLAINTLKNQKTLKISFKLLFKPEFITKIIKYLILTFILTLPYWIKLVLIFKNPIETGYFEDNAGFIFNLDTILKRFANFFFFTGGFFFIPIMLFYKPSKVNKKNIMDFLLSPITLIFLVNSVVLFIWGPYPRLYSVPATISIIWLFDLIQKTPKISIKKTVLAFCILFFLAGFYIYTSQFLGHNDFGYKKFSKLAVITLSFTLTALIILNNKIKLTKSKFILLFSILVVFLNLLIFIDKFRFTRYKYYSILSCIETYLNEKSDKKLAYSSLSGMEEWYLKDFDRKYRYLGSTGNFAKWAKKNQVGYFIATYESGHKDNLGHVGKEGFSKFEIVQSISTPFFEGETKLVKIE